MSDLEQFRTGARHWLEANCPASMRQPVRGMGDNYYGGRTRASASPDQVLWAERMGQRGWTAPRLPRELGGGGLSSAEARVLDEESRSIGARGALMSPGLTNIAPILLEFGSRDQQLEHIPPMIRGETLWCQGFSEPGSGSDLASLQTRAEDMGDHYLVNGSKIWTSFAQNADWNYCLVRTGKGASKHEGITFLMIAMTTPGITVQPIRLISGASPFCQVFYDNVIVPKHYRLGEEGQGWKLAVKVLNSERAGLASLGGDSTDRTPLSRKAVEAMGLDGEGRLADTMLRHDLARLDVDMRAFGLTMARYRDEQAAGQLTFDPSALLKFHGAELNKRRHEINMATRGLDGLGWEGDAFDGGKAPRAWLRSKANSIEGGTSEIQLNIIAKRILSLPAD